MDSYGDNKTINRVNSYVTELSVTLIPNLGCRD